MDTTNITEDFNPLALDNQLCFALYVCSKEIIRKYNPLLEPLGLTYTAYITLLCLWEKDNVPVKELGNRLFLDSGTLTPLLKKMETQGLVTRTRNEKDERTVYIQLTKEGKAKLTVDLFQKFEEEFGRSLSPMEYEIINNWLDEGTSEELILEALKEAIYNNVKSLRYIEKILLNWKDKGYKNRNDVSNGLMKESEDREITSIYEFNWLDNEE